jgi:hypothetical protein
LSDLNSPEKIKNRLTSNEGVIETKDAKAARNAGANEMSEINAKRTNASTGSFQPSRPAEQSFNICISDGHGNLTALVNRDSKFTKKESKSFGQQSIELNELIQRQEGGDKEAKALVDSFEKAMRMRGTQRDTEMAQIQELADKTYGRGAYAQSADNVAVETYENLHIKQAPAYNAGSEIPSVPGSLLGDNKTILNVQISNVPETSSPVSLNDVSQYADIAVGEGAKICHDSAIGVINNGTHNPFAAQDFAILAFTGIGEHFSSNSNQFNQDVSNAVEHIADDLSVPMSPEERAKRAGAMMPIFVPGSEGKIPESETRLAKAHKNLETESDIFSKAGKGGDWPVINERASPNVVRQTEEYSCSSACGEMLTNGELKQLDLIKKLGAPCEAERFAKALGPQWIGNGVTQESLNGLLHQKGWAAELREIRPPTAQFRRIEPGHTVVVDDLDNSGNIMIRDPADGTRYEMTRKNFIEHWNLTAVYRK